MNELMQWFRQLDYDVLIEMIVALAASLLCITVHECCHGLAACCFGDDTAKQAGRLSLNPLRHIDLIGLAVMALLHFGWAKPVPVDMRKMKNPKLGMAVTAIAGPVSNLLLTLAALLLRAFAFCFYYSSSGSDVWYYCVYFLEYVAILSAGLAVFNLFPIPPLDGSKILYSFLPQRAYHFFLRYERYGMIILAVLLFLNVLDTPLLYLRDGLLGVLQGAVDPLFDVLLSRLV